MLLMMATEHGTHANLGMYALLAIPHYMVDVAVHMYFREMQMDSCTAMHHKITDFFEAEDLQEGMLCQEADYNRR